MLVADDLRSCGLPALTRDERVRAFEDLHLPPAASLSQASLIRVGQLVAATRPHCRLAAGERHGSRARRAAHPARYRTHSGSRPRERAPLRDLFALHDRAARQLMGGAASSIPSAATPAATKPIPPLEAFEQYIKGLVAEQPATQIKFLKGALASYPTYDRARLALWEAYTEQGDHARALAAVQAVPADSRRSRQARFLAARSLIELKRYDEAFTTLKALLDEQPTPPLYNNLGVVQVRRGATPQTRHATYFFTKAAEARADESDYFFNLGYAYWLDTRRAGGDLLAARGRAAQSGRRRRAFRARARRSRPRARTTEAAREKELARQLSSKYAGVDEASGRDGRSRPARARAAWRSI